MGVETTDLHLPPGEVAPDPLLQDPEEPIYTNSTTEQSGVIQLGRYPIVWRFVKTRPFHPDSTDDDYSYFFHIEIPLRQAFRLVRVDQDLSKNDQDVTKLVTQIAQELLAHQELEDEQIVASRLREYCRNHLGVILTSLFKNGVNDGFIQRFLTQFIESYAWDNELAANLETQRNMVNSAIQRYFNVAFEEANKSLSSYYNSHNAALQSGAQLSRDSLHQMALNLPYDQVFVQITDHQQLRKLFKLIKKKKYLDTYFECLDKLDSDRKFSALLSQILYILYQFAR